MTLYEQVVRWCLDEQISALIFEDQLEPAAGARTVISPPTYAKDQPSDPPLFAFTEKAFVPTDDGSGWLHDFARNDDGTPRLGGQVVVNALASCAGQAELGLYRQQQRLQVSLPAFVVDGAFGGDRRDQMLEKVLTGKSVTATQYAQIKDALALRVSTWELAHRTADSWLQFADTGAGQLWGDVDSELKHTLMNISHERGDLVYHHAPNVALFGAWLASGTARRHAIPRAYAREVTGFGARPVVRGATKLDPTGGASTESRVQATADGVKVAAKGGKRPSKLGFGQVPSTVEVRGFECEQIVSQGSLSLRALQRFTYPDDTDGQQAAAALVVYTLLAMAGHKLALADGFLRSGCDLVAVKQRWGWRRHGQRAVEDMEIPSLDDIAQALREAVDRAAAAGLEFAAPVTVGLSQVEMQLVVDRVVAESVIEPEAD